jgi:hypothetical protein
LPCGITVAGQPPSDHFSHLHPDIGLLYAGRGLFQGKRRTSIPAAIRSEYPVLTGWSRAGAVDHPALGGLQGAGLTDQQQIDSTLIFVDVNTVLLGLFLTPGPWCALR